MFLGSRRETKALKAHRLVEEARVCTPECSGVSMFSNGWSLFWEVPREMEVAKGCGEVATVRGEVVVEEEEVPEPVGVDGSSVGVTEVELSTDGGGLASKVGT